MQNKKNVGVSIGISRNFGHGCSTKRAKSGKRPRNGLEDVNFQSNLQSESSYVNVDDQSATSNHVGVDEAVTGVSS